MRQTNGQDWIEVQRGRHTGLETLRAHFSGHAFDPHWHDEYLIGITEQGVQEFNCRSKKQTSTPGTSFLIEPGEMHDGDSPTVEGFTYRMLFITQAELKCHTREIFSEMPDNYELTFSSTLKRDSVLSHTIATAFDALHYQEPKIVQDACLDAMLERVCTHLHWRKLLKQPGKVTNLALQVQDFLHANVHVDVGMKEICQAVGEDRFRINRAFKTAFKLAPHQYLIQLRLVKARALLNRGLPPSDVAQVCCFADQSHLGRWFKRSFQLTPANYQQRTYLPN